jgi:hypothetical protein
MKKIEIIIWITIIIAVSASVFVYLRPEIIQQLIFEYFTNQVKIKDAEITYAEKPLKVNITYPQIIGLPGFNQKVKEIISKEISNFKNNSLANDQAIKETDPESYAEYPREYELNISYTKGEVDKNIISVVFQEYNFEGGAHGATIFIPLNYNIKTGQEIKLADVFPGQSDYLQKISDSCIADLTKQITKSLGSTDGTWIKDGAGPKEENFSTFLINKDNIIFYFPQYQVAYYAAGDFQVTMPR